MLICKNCNIEYEEGKKFCRNCGTPLLPKDKPSWPDNKISQLKENRSKEIKICQNCMESYPSGNYCKKCGALLTLQATLKENEIISPSPERIREFTGLQEVEKKPIKQPDEPSTPIIEVQKTKEIKEKEKPLVKKGKKIFSPLIIGSVSAILLIAVGGYLLWPKYSYLIGKKPPPVEKVQQTGPDTTSDTNVSIQKNGQPANQQSEAEIIDSIKNTLETIRQANLQQNIELFMSCYSIDFREREKRRLNTLENWKNFDFLDLSYNLKNWSISGNTAEARVEWFLLTQPKGGIQVKEEKFVLDVTFQNEEGGWKIKETRPVS